MVRFEPDITIPIIVNSQLSETVCSFALPTSFFVSILSVLYEGVSGISVNTLVHIEACLSVRLVRHVLYCSTRFSNMECGVTIFMIFGPYQ